MMAEAARAAEGNETARETFLSVESSATGKRWVMNGADPDLARALARRLDVPDALGNVLAARGVSVEEGERFLTPSLKHSFPDPASFADMDKAVAALSDAIEAKKKIAVFADYDVDGATSAAQFIRYGRARGVEIDLYVPDRIAEGYGPSGQAFAALQARGAELVVTVDCGAMAHDALASAADLGLDIVVLDHHQMTAEPPPALAVVNPNRPDCASGCGQLAAAGVTFVTLAALNREGRRRGVLDGDSEPNLFELLDLAALGTFCDVVPLTGVNRAIASQGLKVMSKRANPGIAALADVAGFEGEANAYTAGFVLGPRINAGGRVGRADLGARLLSTDDRKVAAAIAAELDAFNDERKRVEQAVLDAAVATADAQIQTGDPAVLVVDGEGWHQGVIGIVAGRLKERFHKPTIVIGWPHDEGEPGKGSGRSVPGVDLGGAIAAARDAGILVAGGGHAMAAGLTINRGRASELADFLAQHIAQAGPAPAPVLEIDALVSPSGANRGLADTVAGAGPFGAGNPEPVFVIPDVMVTSANEVGKGHLRVTLSDASGARVNAIAFRAGERGLEAVLRRTDAPLHVAARIKPGRGRYVDVELVDVAVA